MSAEMVAVFPTTHLTLRAEEAFEEEGLPIRTVMKPRRISSDCGLAISLAAADLARAEDVVRARGLGPVGFFRPDGAGWTLVLSIGEGE